MPWKLEALFFIDFTFSGGTVLAWGNNSMAQLGRTPAREIANSDKRLVMLKSSKKVVRLPQLSHATLDTPGQVPKIPSPIVSYQNYEVAPLPGCVQPLSIIEKSPNVTTLHYVLEHFYGLYNSANVLNKVSFPRTVIITRKMKMRIKIHIFQCLELQNYQAAAKLALLENNYSSSLTHQLMAVKHCCRSATNLEDNIKLLDQQIEKNLINSLEKYENKMKKMPASKSLDSFHQHHMEDFVEFEGGVEELYENSRPDDMSVDLTEDSEDEKQLAKEDKEPRKLYLRSITPNNHDLATVSDVSADSQNRSNVTRRALEVVQFYINEVDDDSHPVMRDILHLTLEFWMENHLPIEHLENVFLNNMKKLFYPLGMLLFW